MMVCETGAESTQPPSKKRLWRHFEKSEFESAIKRRRLLLGSATSRLAGLTVDVTTGLLIMGLRFRYRIEIVGTMPVRCVFVATHSTYQDAMLCAALRGDILPVASHHLRRVPGTGWYLAHYGVIWTGSSAVSVAVDAIGRGASVWIAPFGYTRSKWREFEGRPRSGASNIAWVAQIPIVPIRSTFQRGRRFWNRPKVVVSVGSVLDPMVFQGPEELTLSYMATLKLSE